MMAAAMPQVAFAQATGITAYATGQGTPNQIVLNGIYVKAQVVSHCGFATAPSGTYNQPDFDVAGLAHDFGFVLDCTGPSRVAVTSANGGLLNTAAGLQPSGYIAKAPYNVELFLDGTTGDANATCAAATLASGGSCGFVGTASETVGLALNAPATTANSSYLRVSAPAYNYAALPVLVDGTYQDTLTVTVSAQ